MAKTCVEFKTVSREDGSKTERCAKYGPDSSDTALVPAGDGDMGRRKRRRSPKFGLIVPEPLRGVLGIKKIPMVGIGVGGGGSILGMFLARRYGSTVHPAVSQYWPVSGALFGAAASIPLYWVKGRDAMIGGVASAAVVGALGMLANKAAGFDPFAGHLGMRRRRNYGLLTSQQVAGFNPAVADTTRVPRNVQVQTDIAAWGSAI